MPILGSTLQFKVNVYDKDPADGGVLSNAVSVGLDITVPDTAGTVVTATVPAPSLPGVYEYDYVPTTYTGRYVGLWTFTMAGGLIAKYSQVFEVSSTDPGYLISLAAAKSHLNIPDSNTENDTEIVGWLSSITEIVEFYCGACVPRTIVEYHEAARMLMLEVTPVLSVTSILPYLTAGLSYTTAQLKVSPDGRVMLKDGTTFYWGPYEVTYVAGRRTMPAGILDAVKIILEHMYETQRGPSGLPFQNQELNSPAAGMGYLVPNRALELLKAHDRGPSAG
jgi:hypothetical protein